MDTVSVRTERDKVASRMYNKIRRERYPEEEAARHHAYYERNKERIKAQQAAYREAHREERREKYNLRYRNDDEYREKVKQRNLKYYYAHRNRDSR